MSSIPTSTSVSESAVISAPLSAVWHLIKLPSFPEFWTRLDKSDHVKGTSEETDIYRWTFKDGTVLDIKQEAHSSIDHYITYSAIAANPALTYSSVVSTIRCWPVTSGAHAGSTFVQWTANFSSDADAGVIEDARFKRQEALADLAAAATKRK
ncbi:Bet v1-like protein [Punctularia strigosozonata HHB-11173 SS5]|uniref:Bet v1-like protein n=1 Tax=Punctularia strigosozonata (strain HHB-11173) TaxID=741275 RepID=UPI0004418241|nr:Bet v1-like protein [Punctularia strigosozonata HHB-11173 SS5]EIN06048.1 Bet v1-like protein [Punctularia strigosozonata HHB-11173 SS5]